MVKAAGDKYPSTGWRTLFGKGNWLLDGVAKFSYLPLTPAIWHAANQYVWTLARKLRMRKEIDNQKIGNQLQEKGGLRYPARFDRYRATGRLDQKS